MRARFPQGRRARRLECPVSLSFVRTILSEDGYHARIFGGLQMIAKTGRSFVIPGSAF